MSDKCTICGKVVDDQAGRFVTVIGTPDNEGNAERITEYHCFDCDPVVDTAADNFVPDAPPANG